MRVQLTRAAPNAARRYCTWAPPASMPVARRSPIPRQPAPLLSLAALLVGCLTHPASAAMPILHPPFENRDALLFSNLDPGPSSPYGTTVTVAGITTAVSKVTVTLFSVTHGFPDDLDILLVGPRGQRVLLLSDAGLDSSVSGATLILDDDAASRVPDDGPIVAGTFLPSNYGTIVDVFAAPAPAAPYVTNLAVFRNTDPNGVWRLFAMDDQPEDGGFIDGWRLTLTTETPLANLSLAALLTPAPVVAGETVTVSFGVTNLGPAVASGVVLTNPLPSNFTLESADATQGSCALDQGVVRCDLGELGLLAGAQVDLVARALIGGTNTLTTGVFSSDLDLTPANNTAAVQWSAALTANLNVAYVNPVTNLLHGQTITYSIGLTNSGPNQATVVRLTNRLDGAATILTALPNQGSCAVESSNVVCQLGNMAPGAGVLVTITALPSQPGILTNTVTLGSLFVDPVPENNSATLLTTVQPVANLAVHLSPLANLTPLGQPLPVTLRVTNLGPSVVSQVLLTNIASPALPVSDISTQFGECTESNGVLTCLFDPIPPGESREVTFDYLPISPGPFTNALVAASNTFDPILSNNAASQSTAFAVLPPPFSAPSEIVIAENGPAAPFPSTLFVSGLTAAVHRVSVSLNQLHHSFPDDLNVVLVSPAGTAVALLSDAGGSTPVLGIDLTFDPSAVQQIPNNGPMVSGTYLPSLFSPAAILLPAPAPPGPYAQSLNAFQGANPNGTWSLFVFDDRDSDAGSLVGGWSLQFALIEPIADLTVATDTPVLTAAAVPFTITVQVANAGPGTTSNVELDGQLAAGLEVLEVATDRGQCDPVGPDNASHCDLQSLAPGEAALITYQVVVQSAGMWTNAFVVSGSTTELTPANNQTGSTTETLFPPAFIAQPQAVSVLPGEPAGLMVEVSGSEVVLQWFRNELPLEGETNASITVKSATLDDAGIYTVTASNRIESVSSQPAILAVRNAPTIIMLSPGRVTSTNFILIDQIVPNGLHATAYFEWGETESYGNTTPPLDLGDGVLPIELSQALGALPADAVFHARAVATNDFGQSFGPDFAFSWTLDAPANLAILLLESGAVAVAFTGHPSQSYTVEITEDFSAWRQADWAEELQPGEFTFLDPEPPAVRFYRVLAP